MHEEKITVEVLGISHDISSRSQAVFFDSEIPVAGAAEQISQPMVCVGVEDFADDNGFVTVQNFLRNLQHYMA